MYTPVRLLDSYRNVRSLYNILYMCVLLYGLYVCIACALSYYGVQGDKQASSGGSGLPGGVAKEGQRNIYEQVSRIFGHAKFRNGQKEVIVVSVCVCVILFLQV